MDFLTSGAQEGEVLSVSKRQSVHALKRRFFESPILGQAMSFEAKKVTVSAPKF